MQKRSTMDMHDVREEVDRMAIKTDHLKTLPVAAKRRVAALENLYRTYGDLERQFREEMDALERKYVGLYTPLFDRRAAIVTGAAEPTEQETQGFKAEPEAMPADVRGIPMFWYYALSNNDTIRELTGLSEHDKEALAFLTDIRYTLLPRTRETVTVPASEDGSAPAITREVIHQGFSISFAFAENPFFPERLLSKTYFLTEDQNGDPMFERAESVKPTWNAGKNLTVRVIKKTVGGKRGGRGGKRGGRGGAGGQVMTVEEPVPSFFQFFTPPELPSAGEEMDPDDFDEISNVVQEDFEVGCEIRDTLCSKAVLYYTGQAVEEEDEFDDGDEDEDDEDDDEEDDDDEDDDDEDEDEEEEDHKPHKGHKCAGHCKHPTGAGNKPAAPGQDGKENPECKQQ